MKTTLLCVYASCGIGLFLVGCTDPKIPLVSKSSISPKLLHGRWMISAVGIDYLKSKGVLIYTNRSDHVLVLDDRGEPSFAGFGGTYDFVVRPGVEKYYYHKIEAGTNSFGQAYTWTNFLYRAVDLGILEAVALVDSVPSPETSPFRFYVGTDAKEIYLWKPIHGGTKMIRFERADREERGLPEERVCEDRGQP